MSIQELKQIRPCNIHSCHPLSDTDWGKRSCFTPDGKRRGGTACRGAGGTVDSIAQLLTKCKKKETAIPLLKEFLDNTENSLEGDIRCPQFSPPGNRTVDKPAGVGYNTSTKGAASRRLPTFGLRSNRYFGESWAVTSFCFLRMREQQQ